MVCNIVQFSRHAGFWLQCLLQVDVIAGWLYCGNFRVEVEPVSKCLANSANSLNVCMSRERGL